MLKDIFGKELERNVLLRETFIEPPFSVLDTKSGNWKRRKKQWQKLGIKSEVGRDATTFNIKEWMEKVKGHDAPSNTSIFDPALCELLYHWFCPKGGKILDPFSGGSVRGIVANYLGYHYTGIDLSQKQIDSNREQALNILPINNQPQWLVGDSNIKLDTFIYSPVINNKVKISVPSLKLMFQKCEPNYIKKTCKGRCCEGSSGLMVTIHDSEIEKMKSMGVTVKDGFIEDITNCGICPLKRKNGLCSIHEEKPYGCRVAPFT